LKQLLMDYKTMSQQITTKKCNFCNEYKCFDKFSIKKSGKFGISARCKICDQIYNQNYYLKNKEKIIKNVNAWSNKNKDKKRNYSNNWVERNKEKSLTNNSAWRNKNKEKMIQCRKSWFIRNRNKVNELRKNNYNSNSIFSFISKTRCLILSSFNRKKMTKRNKTEQILGCNFNEFKIHIEKQFLKGMTWEKRSEWHIDHIVPISSAKTEEDVIKLNHYTNLRPLWAKDNLKKSNKHLYLI